MVLLCIVRIMAWVHTVAYVHTVACVYLCIVPTGIRRGSNQDCEVVVALPRLQLRHRLRSLFFDIVTCPVGPDSDSDSHYKSCIVTTTPGDFDSDSATLALT